MIRALNLVANFSVNTAQFNAGMQQIESSAQQVAAKLNSLQAGTEAYKVKSERMAQELSSLTSNRAKLLLDFETQTSKAIDEKTARTMRLVMDSRESRRMLDDRLNQIKTGVEATEKYDSKIMKLQADLTTNLQKNFDDQIGMRKKAATEEYVLLSDELEKKKKIFSEEVSARRRALDTQIEDLKKAAQKEEEIIRKSIESATKKERSAVINLNAAQVVRDQRIAGISSNTSLTPEEKNLAELRANRQYSSLERQLNRPVIADLTKAESAQDRLARINSRIDSSRQEMAGLYGLTPKYTAAEVKKQQRMSVLEDFINNYGINQFRIDQQNLINPQIDRLKAGRDASLASYQAKKQREIDRITAAMDKLPVGSDLFNKLDEDIKKLNESVSAYEKKLDNRINRLQEELDAANKFIDARTNEVAPRATAAKSALHSDLIRQRANQFENYDYTASRIQMATMGVGLVAGGAAKFGADLNSTILKEQHNVSLTNPADLALMRSTIKNAGVQTGVGFDTLATGFREAENYFGKASDAVKVFNASLKASVSTGAEMHNTTDTLSKVIKTFGGNANDADKYMRGLVRTAQLSSLEMNQLAQVGGQVYGMLGSVGISFEEANASLITFTKYGLNATEAATQLRNEIIKLYQPSKEVKKLLQFYSDKSGVNLVDDFTFSGLKKRGIGGTFGDIRQAAQNMNMSPQELATKLFPNNRATVAGLLMTRDDVFKTFKESVNDVHKSLSDTGAFIDKNFNQTLDDMNTSIGRVKNTFQVMASDFATLLQPTLKSVADGLSTFAKWFGELPDGVKIATANITIFTIAVGILATTVVRAMQAFSAFKLAQATMGVALPKVIESLNALSTNPQIGAAASSTGVIAQLTARFAQLGALLTNPYVLGGIALIAGITALVYAYNKVSEAVNKTTGDIVAEYTAGSQAAQVKQEQAKKTQELVKEIIELQKKTKLSADESVSLHSKLNELAGISPELIKSFSATGNAIGLIATALKDANEQLKKANFQKYLTEAAPLVGNKLKLSEERSDLIDKLQPYLHARQGSMAAALDVFGYDKYESLKKLGGLNQALDVEIQKIRGQIASVQDKIKAASVENQKWQKNIGIPLKNGLSPVLLDANGKPKADGNGNGDELEMEQIQARINAQQARVSSMASKYREYSEKVKFFNKPFSERERNMFEQSMLRPGTLLDEATMKQVGKPKDVLAQLDSLFARLAIATNKLAGEFDDLSEKKKVQDLVSKARDEYNAAMLDLNDRLSGRAGEKEKTHLEKANEWLASRKILGPSMMQIRASELDDKERNDVLGSQRVGLASLLSHKKYDENSTMAKVFRYFAENKQLAEEYGPLNILFTAASAQKRENDIEKMKGLLKDFADFSAEMARQQRQAARDFAAAMYEPFKVFDKINGGLAKSKGDFLKRILPEGSFEAWFADKYDGANPNDPFYQQHDGIAKARQQFAYDQNKSFIDKGVGFLRGQRKRHSDLMGRSPDDTFALENFGMSTSEMLPGVLPQVQAMRELSTSLDKIEAYQKRVRQFGEVFVSVFSRAFDSVLLKSGKFWKSLGEGFKDSLLRMASGELSKALFDGILSAAEHSGLLKKPGLTDKQKSMLSAPELFAESLKDVLYNQGNVLAVRVVGGTGGGLNNPSLPSSIPSTSSDSGGYDEYGNDIPASSASFSGKGKNGDLMRGLQWASAANQIKNKNYIGAAVTIGSLTKAINPTIGMALAANDLLGNPVGKAGNWLKKTIFHRSNGGPAFANKPYFFEGGKPEVFIPDQNGYISNNQNMGGRGESIKVEHHGDIIVNDAADIERVSSAIAYKLRMSRGYAKV